MNMESYRAMQSFDVIIVGAGLVGLTLAKSLTAANFSVAIVDANAKANATTQIPELHSFPFQLKELDRFDLRVSALNLYSKFLLERLGIWSHLNAERLSGFRNIHVWEFDGTGQVDFSAEDIQQLFLGYIVENSLLQQAILTTLTTAENLTTFFNQAVVELGAPYATSRGDQRILTLGSGQKIKAPLIIAADGANSQLRDWAGFPMNSWPCQQEAIVTTVVIEKSHQQTAWQVFNTTGILAFLPLPDHAQHHHASIVWSLDSSLSASLKKLNQTEFARALQEAFQNKLGNVEVIDDRLSFPLTQRRAKEYVKPSLLLIGDAAHTIHPLAGQGLNLGLRDVAILTDELIQAKNRQEFLGNLSVLKRYQRRCAGHNFLMQGVMEGLKRFFAQNALPIRWLRNQGMNWVNQLTPLKSQLIELATGLQDIETTD